MIMGKVIVKDSDLIKFDESKAFVEVSYKKSDREGKIKGAH